MSASAAAHHRSLLLTEVCLCRRDRTQSQVCCCTTCRCLFTVIKPFYLISNSLSLSLSLSLALALALALVVVTVVELVVVLLPATSYAHMCEILNKTKLNWTYFFSVLLLGRHLRPVNILLRQLLPNILLLHPCST